jgi:hypothetical protein
MSVALRLVEDTSSETPPSSRTGQVAAARLPRATIHPTMLSTMLPTRRPVTLVPSARPVVHAIAGGVRVTEAPVTQRSATTQPRLDDVARIEARNIVGLMRCNVSFLESLLRGNAPLDALGALEDLHQGLDRIEDRFAMLLPLAPLRTR